ncbi:hypothetical protein BGX34_001339 [Mortierella sp. NVP85]|nr:hypothetical protein BGX34_001339 [Mortierella sp. NVP85]
MLGFLFLLLSGVVAVQTKPDKDSFAPFWAKHRRLLEQSITSRASGSSTPPGESRGGGAFGWLQRKINEGMDRVQALQMPEHTIEDCFFFQLAKMNDGTGSYIGMFQSWWVLSELQEVDPRRNNLSRESQADNKKQEAVQAKIKKDYGGAGKKYVEAAKLYQAQGNQFNLFEAAAAYEEAYKAYNMDKKNENLAIQNLEKAAEIFASIERGGSRAARLYTTLGDTVKAKDSAKAAEVYGKAAELYASEGDGRALHTTIRQAEQLCILHQYDKAYPLYDNTIIPQTLTQDILRYTTRDHILNAMIAHLAVTKGDWVVFKKDLERYQEMCADFNSSTARCVLEKLANAEHEHDSDAFTAACQEFNRLSSGGMQDWQVSILLEEKRKMEESVLL